MWQKNVRYLDYNAASGLSEYVRLKLIEILQNDVFFANPSSQHRLGQKVRKLLFEASSKVAKSLGKQVMENDLLFTASGTEANQTIIRSQVKHAKGMILGKGEHPASYDLASFCRDKIEFFHELPLASNGQYDFLLLEQLLNRAEQEGVSSLFLSLFWVNHETGVVTDLTKLKAIIDQSRVPVTLHLDAAQAWGKIEINLPETPAHWVSFSAQKIGALSGTGLIWTRPGLPLEPYLIGSQGNGLRGGSENILGILATGFAAESLRPKLFIESTLKVQNEIEKKLREFNVKIWGESTERVSNTTRVSFLGFSAYENWVELLDLEGIGVSHGSACRSKVIEPSRILLQMGAYPADALNAIRVSWGPQNTQEDGTAFIDAIRKILTKKMNRSLMESP